MLILQSFKTLLSCSELCQNTPPNFKYDTLDMQLFKVAMKSIQKTND